MNGKHAKVPGTGLPRAIRSRLVPVGGLVVVAVLVAGAAIVSVVAAPPAVPQTPDGHGVALAGSRSVGYVLTDGVMSRESISPAFSGDATVAWRRHRQGRARLRYTISGDATKVLYPGGSSTIDLSFYNPNPATITVPSRSITITMSSAQRLCFASANFRVVHTLTTAVTIPGGATRTLSDLGVPPADWPVIEMRDTSFTQSACLGATVHLHYRDHQ